MHHYLSAVGYDDFQHGRYGDPNGKTRVIKEHGNWHIMLKEPSEQQIEQIAQRTDVMTSSRYDGLNFDLSEDYTINGKAASS